MINLLKSVFPSSLKENYIYYYIIFQLYLYYSLTQKYAWNLSLQ